MNKCTSAQPQHVFRLQREQEYKFVLVFLHKSLVFFGTEFILISLISLSVYFHKMASRHSVLLYSPVGEYLTIIRQRRGDYRGTFAETKSRSKNLTNQLVGFVIFTCAKVLMPNTEV